MNDFLTAGVDVVHLPSGWVIRGRLPAVEDLYIREVVPDDLLNVAAQFAQGGSAASASEPDKARWHRFLRLLVAEYVVQVQVNGKWHDQVVTIEDTFTMDARDVDELEYIVLRLKTAAQVSATWQADRGEISDEAANEIWQREVARSLRGWSNFRALAEGLARGPDSADVQPTPESVARPNRATRRARAGRGANGATVGRRPGRSRPTEATGPAGDDVRDGVGL